MRSGMLARSEVIFARKELRAGSFAVSVVSKSDEDLDGPLFVRSFLRRVVV